MKDNNLPSKRALQVSYVVPRSGGAKLQIKDLLNGTSVLLPFRYNYPTTLEQALEYLKDRKIKISAKAFTCGDMSTILLTNNLETPLE